MMCVLRKRKKKRKNSRVAVFLQLLFWIQTFSKPQPRLSVETDPGHWEKSTSQLCHWRINNAVLPFCRLYFSLFFYLPAWDGLLTLSVSFWTISSVSRSVSTCDAPIKAKLGGVIEKGNPSLLQFCAQEGWRGWSSNLNSCCCTTVKLGGNMTPLSGPAS